MTWQLRFTCGDVRVAFAARLVRNRAVFRGSNHLFAFHGLGGAPAWSCTLEADQQMGQKLLAATDELAISFEDGGTKGPTIVFAVDPESGERVWSTDLPFQVVEGGLDLEGDQIYVRGSDEVRGSTIATLDLASGSVVQQVPCPNGTGLVACGGQLYLGGLKQLSVGAPGGPFESVLSGRISHLRKHGAHLIFAHGGRRSGDERFVARWEAASRQSLADVRVEATTTAVSPTPLPGAPHLAVVTPGRGQGVVLLDLEQGTERWRAEGSADEEVAAICATPHGVVVAVSGVGSAGNVLRALHPVTGTENAAPACRDLPERAYWLGDVLYVSGLTWLQAFTWSAEA